MEVVIYTKDWCPYCDRAKDLLARKGVPFTEIDVTSDAEREREMIERSDGRMTVPQIFIDGVGIGGCDEMHELEKEGRLDVMLGKSPETGAGPKSRPDPMEKKIWNVVVLGSGPAGLTAAIYAARGNLQPLLIEGVEAGGQLMITSDVENYPGFPDGILGPELMKIWKEQAERFGTTFLQGDATEVDLSSQPLRVSIGKQTILSRTVIIGTGASARKIGLESEKKLWGRGVSYCATCDGFFFRDKELVVVGGGDSAMEEGTFLTKYASKVTVIHRRSSLRASKIMQERAFKNPRISFIWDTVVEEVLGVQEGKVTGVLLRNAKTGEASRFPCDGLFVAIGHTPNTRLFEGQLEMDRNGYIITRNGTTSTSVAGVFAAGDVADHVYRQAVTAAGTGCMAAIDAERYLEASH